MTGATSGGAETDRATGGVALARGAGYGFAFGGAAGLFVAPVTDLVTFTDEPFDPATFVLAVYTAPVGALYGLLAGLLAGAVVALAPTHRRTPTFARWSAAIVGPAVIVAVSWMLFRPRWRPGPNETWDHVAETLVFAYAYPCLAAAAVALAFGPRLVAPAVLDDTPSWA